MPTFDDEDLSISLTPSNSHRGHGKGVDTQSSHGPANARHPAAGVAKPAAATQRLGQYSIIKTLGEGSFGKVKLAVHQVSGQKVALKIISRKKLISRDMAGRVEREISYLQLLRHPHIIKLFTVITSPSEIIMVLEYAGGELFDYIVQHGKMGEDSARRFFQQIICAVEYCHRHKIVHRDLKPENLLLDEFLNVKIADFGLSNIMTDGNFLKTSCGSPNYAAPEVISGKLYAGPEVDVWSSGVILYVLLVGRLPFDDEYIPTLFKKIAQGNFTVPNYLSSGAVNLIRKMLVVNPVHRITVQEIRQDPWFIKNLPDYLQPPVEEFIDTGVDPNKAINPRALAPGKPEAVQEQLHETVIGKLGKTMGYAKDDVQDALGKDEPSAIKDAYLIVRENQIMKTNPHLSNAQELQPFLAQSPPTWNPSVLASPRLPSVSPREGRAQGQAPSPITRDVDRTLADKAPPSAADISDVKTPPASSIGVLPSSLPTYHRAYMAGRPKSEATASSEQAAPVGDPQQQSNEEQAATARRLKPHSRSQLNLDKAEQKPESMTPLPPKKPRPPKWQFGIRSRSLPYEAMLCLYRALQRLGAEWEIADPKKDEDGRQESPSRDEASAGWSDDEGHHRKKKGPHGEDAHSSDSGSDIFRRDRSGSSKGSSSDSGRRRPRRHNVDGVDTRPGYGYIPEDPWVIHCRWLKDGMYPPGTVHPSSAHSSAVNLASTDLSRKRNANVGTVGGASDLTITSTDSASHTGPGSVTESSSSYPEPNNKVYVYMTIQLYTLERGFYLVDFKCDGYERVLEEEIDDDEGRGGLSARTSNLELRNSGLGTGVDLQRKTFDVSTAEGQSAAQDHISRIRKRLELRGAGRASGDKECSSPFPFLDLASKLIIALAEAE
ncbi:MAG: Protein kinase [Piccolia ochrophora]|nr:MAG: Protein kinase [Piccolia ochrophora]